jgi:cytochrome c-type biogenesis protein CcsB
MKRFPAFVLLSAALTIQGFAQTAPQAPQLPQADSSHLEFKQFGLLAIQDGGRRKPIDTFARETLTKITGRSSYTDKNARHWSANDFILSALLETRDWKAEPMVLVSFGQLKTQLGLPQQQRRFSYAQLTASTELQRIANEAHALKRAEKELNRVQQEALAVGDRLALLAHVMDGSALLIVPAAKSATEPWAVPDPPAVAPYYNEQQFAPAMASLTQMMRAYQSGDSFNFSAAARQVRETLRALSPSIYPTESQLRTEYLYNHLDAFYDAIWFYALGFALLLVTHLGGGGTRSVASKNKVDDTEIVPPLRGRALRDTGVVIALAGLAFHATGILLRCMIGGRPPVTNMYESIIWVSFAVTFFGMIFFARYRTPVYLLAAVPVTLIALLLVHQMPIAMPSSIDPLVPVLRDNFWLTIHVLTITLSYAAFALAMGFGHILLFRYARNPRETRADAPMHFWLYRVLQLGVLLLAAGTILGGVWANYSWGRFWGWDPKETWALIALLCYITTLHGRLAGWWTQFGLVVASVVCFLAVLMAWYGVNFVLGKGLHSYGFGIGGETYVVSFVIADLLFVAFATWRYRTTRRAITGSRELPAESVAV